MIPLRCALLEHRSANRRGRVFRNYLPRRLQIIRGLQCHRLSGGVDQDLVNQLLTVVYHRQVCQHVEPAASEMTDLAAEVPDLDQAEELDFDRAANEVSEEFDRIMAEVIAAETEDNDEFDSADAPVDLQESKQEQFQQKLQANRDARQAAEQDSKQGRFKRGLREAREAV